MIKYRFCFYDCAKRGFLWQASVSLFIFVLMISSLQMASAQPEVDGQVTLPDYNSEEASTPRSWYIINRDGKLGFYRYIGELPVPTSIEPVNSFDPSSGIFSMKGRLSFPDGTHQRTADPVGPKGDEGPLGLQGPKGYTGPKGDRGNQGAKGDTGPAVKTSCVSGSSSVSCPYGEIQLHCFAGSTVTEIRVCDAPSNGRVCICRVDG